MSGAIKMEGFQPSPASNDSPTRPVLNRPFSDGSMTVDSSILSSLMDPAQSFTFGPGSMSNQAPFDYNMVSPQQQVMDLPGGTSPHSFQPHAMFGHLTFGAENREPPILSSSLDNNNPSQNHETANRSRSQSSSRSSHFGKAPVARSRTGRKLSMNETKPNLSSIRGRTMQPPRSMSFQTDSKPNLINLGPRHHSITSAEYAFEQQYGISIPRNDFGRGLWGPSGSAPSGIDSLPPFGTSADGTAPLESPMTPAQSVHALLGDESRKQRRRECHNQVEKRRREHINAMIEELNKLLPPRFKNPLDPDVAIEDDEDDENAAESPVKKKRAASTSKQQKDAAQCKGRILSDSVQYIRDLQNVTSQQSSRIKYLESLISQGPISGGALEGSSHNTYASDSLEAMGASPEEPERLVSVNQTGWSNFNSAANMLVFEPSPTDASSGPEAQRSTPLSSGSPETDSKDGVVWAGLMELAEETARPRKDSQAELQSSMSNMELDMGMDDRRTWAF